MILPQVESLSFSHNLKGALLAALALAACDREILLGDLAGLSSGGVGGAVDEPPGQPSRLVFSSGFETGDFSEWNEPGSTVNTSGGVVSIGTQAHEGLHAALFSTEVTGEHVVISIRGDWSEVLVGFWILFEELYVSPNWPILHIDSDSDAGTVELWDLGLDNSMDGVHRLFLWEKPVLSADSEGSRIASAADGFAVGEWTQIQVHVRTSAESDGFIRVYQGERLLIDLSDRPAGTGDPMTLGFGSFAYNLEPLPARFWIDDVTVHVP